MKNTIKTLLIILSILSANMTLAISKMLTDIVDPPNTAALNIVIDSLSSLKELRKQNQATPENIKALINIKLLPNIAIEVATQLTLEDYWNTLNSKEKQLFQRYITYSLIKDYSGVLSTYDQLDSINVSVNSEIKRRGNKALVKLLVAFNNKPSSFKLTFKMVYSNRWRIYDISFSGVSLIKNYQAQFNSHIKRKGINSLVKKITKKLSKVQ